MSDGIKIAIELIIMFIISLNLYINEKLLSAYLPEDQKYNKYKKYPSILVVTRYNRNNKIRWPFTYIYGEHMSLRGIKYIKKLIPAGFAFVIVHLL